MNLKRLLFPDEPRPLPGRRGLKIVLRAGHALCAALLLGAVVYGAEPDAVRAAWHWTIVSGATLLLLDLHETGVFLVQVRGLLVMTKVLVVVSLPALGDARAGVLFAVFVLSVLSSHAPASIRYRVVYGAKTLRGSSSKG